LHGLPQAYLSKSAPVKRVFTQQEIDEIIDIGYLNGLFVLARRIGLIGHTFDQKRLKQPLYHPWEDVLYAKYA
jgi:ATP citrate (pro-S)-lyase